MANQPSNNTQKPRANEDQAQSDAKAKAHLVHIRKASPTSEAMFVDPSYSLEQVFEIALWCKGEFAVNRLGQLTITKLDSVGSVLFVARPGDYVGRSGEGQFDFFKVSAEEIETGAWEITK